MTTGKKKIRRKLFPADSLYVNKTILIMMTWKIVKKYDKKLTKTIVFCQKL